MYLLYSRAICVSKLSIRYIVFVKAPGFLFLFGLSSHKYSPLMALSCYNIAVTRMASASRPGLKLPFSGETSNIVRCLRPFWTSTPNWKLATQILLYTLRLHSTRYQEPAPMRTQETGSTQHRRLFRGTL